MNGNTTKHNNQVTRIKNAARRRGISQTAIAREAGVTPQHVCHVFSGRLKSKRVMAVAKRMIAAHDGAAA